MAEYIKRESLIAWLHNMAVSPALIAAIKNKERFPAADVVEVKHGEWVKTNEGQKCSNCKCLSSLWDDNLKFVYCPWCGAKMNGERRSENES